MIDHDRFYTVKETAGILSVSRDTVVRQLRAFTTPRLSKNSKRVYFGRHIKGSEIIRFIGANTGVEAR